MHSARRVAGASFPDARSALLAQHFHTAGALRKALLGAGMLLQNYRSHASLLAIPNRLFYGDQLQAAADQQMLRPPHWETLRPAQQDNSLATIEEGQPICICPT